MHQQSIRKSHSLSEPHVLRNELKRFIDSRLARFMRPSIRGVRYGMVGTAGSRRLRRSRHPRRSMQR